MSKQYEEFHNEVYSRDNPESDSNGWIRWKGTDVCMDVHCECGHHSHIDGEFAYYFQCVGCGKKFAIGQNVRMIPLTDEQAGYAESRHRFFTDEDA